MKTILLIEFDDEKAAHIVEDRLRSEFGLLVTPLRVKMPSTRLRGWQRNAEDALSEVCRLRVEHEKDLGLGFTDADLYVPDMNFVFGLASSDGRCGVVSSNRLKAADPRLFNERVLKEAIHELGHVLGLQHCDDPRCVMHFSNSLMDTDVKNSTLCSSCSSRLAL